MLGPWKQHGAPHVAFNPAKMPRRPSGLPNHGPRTPRCLASDRPPPTAPTRGLRTRVVCLSQWGHDRDRERARLRPKDRAGSSSVWQHGTLMPPPAALGRRAAFPNGPLFAARARLASPKRRARRRARSCSAAARSDEAVAPLRPARELARGRLTRRGGGEAVGGSPHPSPERESRRAESCVGVERGGAGVLTAPTSSRTSSARK